MLSVSDRLDSGCGVSPLKSVLYRNAAAEGGGLIRLVKRFLPGCDLTPQSVCTDGAKLEGKS